MRIAAIGLVGLAAAAAGCYVHFVRAHPGDDHREGMVVAVEPGHVHSDVCGHYYHGGSWFLVERHAHGPGCGHIFHRGLGWVYAEPVMVPHGHVCAPACPHYRCGGRWYSFYGHRHGPGCGHALLGGVWVIGD